MTAIKFNSGFTLLPGLLPDFDPLTIEQEPQFFGADLDYASDHGGPITQAFLHLVPQGWFDEGAILDSRVHMLMEGWMPCIPGWHLDDIPRTRKDGQPDHLNPSYRAEHILALVGNCSRTAFLTGGIELQDVPDGELGIGGLCPETSIYGKWHADIEQQLQGPPGWAPEVELAPERRLIQFNDQSFHRGTPATHAGWRWFARVTRGSDRKPFNKVRTQTQVYLPTPNAGW
jgi:hypothetical protein